MEKINTKLWDLVSKTNPDFTRKVTYGNYGYTTITAYYQIQEATKVFGVYGQGFGLKNISHELINFSDGRILLVCHAIFYAKWEEAIEFDLSSSIMLSDFDKSKALKIDDDAYKKVQTDVLTKALSKIGFNSDVFMGSFDDNKYVNSLKEHFLKQQSKEKINQDAVLHEIMGISSREGLKDVYKKYKKDIDNNASLLAIMRKKGEDYPSQGV